MFSHQFMVTVIGIWRMLCHSKNPLYLENVVETTRKKITYEIHKTLKEFIVLLSCLVHAQNLNNYDNENIVWRGSQMEIWENSWEVEKLPSILQA